MIKETKQEIKASIPIEKNGDRDSRFRIVQRLRLIDVLTITYLSIIAFSILIFHHRVENWTFYFCCHFFAVVCLLSFCHFTYSTTSKVIAVIRDIYPFFLFTFMFKEISQIITIFFPFWLEQYLIDADKFIFGGVLPTVAVQKMYHPWLTEIMAFSYLSYFMLLPVALIVTYRKSYKMFRDYIYTVSFTFYFCYLSFLFLTARGPQQTLAHYHIAREAAGVFDALVLSIQSTAAICGGAFPSSHVAAIGVMCLFVLKAHRTLGYVVLLIAFFLALSTVYLQYHYAVDVIAGVLVIFIIYPLAGFVKNQCARRGIYV